MVPGTGPIVRGFYVWEIGRPERVGVLSPAKNLVFGESSCLFGISLHGDARIGGYARRVGTDRDEKLFIVEPRKQRLKGSIGPVKILAVWMTITDHTGAYQDGVNKGRNIGSDFCDTSMNKAKGAAEPTSSVIKGAAKPK